MSETELLLWIAVVGMASLLAISLVNWIVSERDERRWRRQLREQQAEALVRETRYGTSKRRGL